MGLPGESIEGIYWIPDVGPVTNESAGALSGNAVGLREWKSGMMLYCQSVAALPAGRYSKTRLGSFLGCVGFFGFLFCAACKGKDFFFKSLRAPRSGVVRVEGHLLRSRPRTGG